MRGICEEFGNVEKVDVRNGFAFVIYENHAGVRAAVAGLDNSEWMGEWEFE